MYIKLEDLYREGLCPDDIPDYEHHPYENDWYMNRGLDIRGLGKYEDGHGLL
jgi:hypothetical protein